MPVLVFEWGHLYSFRPWVLFLQEEFNTKAGIRKGKIEILRFSARFVSYRVKNFRPDQQHATLRQFYFCFVRHLTADQVNEIHVVASWILGTPRYCFGRRAKTDDWRHHGRAVSPLVSSKLPLEIVDVKRFTPSCRGFVRGLRANSSHEILEFCLISKLWHFFVHRRVRGLDYHAKFRTSLLREKSVSGWSSLLGYQNRAWWLTVEYKHVRRNASKHFTTINGPSNCNTWGFCVMIIQWQVYIPIKNVSNST